MQFDNVIIEEHRPTEAQKRAAFADLYTAMHPETMQIEQATALSHFLKLAKRGGRPAASSGEQQAHQLMLSIQENCQGLDTRAVRGAMEFLNCALSGDWPGC